MINYLRHERGRTQPREQWGSLNYGLTLYQLNSQPRLNWRAPYAGNVGKTQGKWYTQTNVQQRALGDNGAGLPGVMPERPACCLDPQRNQPDTDRQCDLCGHRWWDSWECILMKLIKGKWIFIMLYLTNVDYTIWRISFWLLCCLNAVHSGCIKEKYYSYSMYSTFHQHLWWIMNDDWCGSLQNHHVLELLNVTRQCKMRFFYINMHFSEQNIHVLCNMKSYECHLMNIKG